MGNLAILKKFADFAAKNSNIKSKQSKDNKTRKRKVSGIIRPITKADINNGKKYKEQFKQLHLTVGKNKTMRALSNWALNFFDDEPDIKAIAKAVSTKVDKTLYAPNRIQEHLQSLSIIDVRNLDYWFQIPGTKFKITNNKSYRKLMEYQSRLMEKTTTAWAINYRMPKILSSALVSTKYRVGKCEEHSFLSLYLLNVGHMIQNMPYGMLKNDIFYTGAAKSGHAYAILVKGKEFKEAILKAKAKTAKSDITSIYNWLMKNTKKWGKNAWIVDGWNTKNVGAISSRSKEIVFDKDDKKNTRNTFKRAFSDNKLSKWDLTIKQMIYRVAKKYGITIK